MRLTHFDHLDVSTLPRLKVDQLHDHAKIMPLPPKQQLHVWVIHPRMSINCAAASYPIPPF